MSSTTEKPKIDGAAKVTGILLLAGVLWVVLLRYVLDGWAGVGAAPLAAWIMWATMSKYAVKSSAGKVWVLTFVVIMVTGMLFGWLMEFFQFATLISIFMALILATLMSRNAELLFVETKMFLDSIQGNVKEQD